MQGVVMQMITHGISTGALFIIAGTLYERIHTRDMNSMGGFWKPMPFMGTIALIFAMASLGLPGLGNFIAEFLTLVGSWQANKVLTIFATIGLVGATIYSLRIVQKIFYGDLNAYTSHPSGGGLSGTEPSILMDLSMREKFILIPMVIVIIWLGLFPQLVLNTSKEAISDKVLMRTGEESRGNVTRDALNVKLETPHQRARPICYV
jgi:NADH-quinone oxidoreductase subunit M